MSYAEYGSLYGKPGVEPLKSPARVYDDAETEMAVKSLLRETAGVERGPERNASRGASSAPAERRMPLRKGARRAKAGGARPARRGPSLKLSAAIAALAALVAFPLLLPAFLLLAVLSLGGAWLVLGSERLRALAGKRAAQPLARLAALRERVTDLFAGEPHKLPEKMLEDPFDRLAERLRQG